MNSGIPEKEFMEGVKEFLAKFSDEELLRELDEKEREIRELERPHQTEQLRWVKKPELATVKALSPVCLHAQGEAHLKAVGWAGDAWCQNSQEELQGSAGGKFQIRALNVSDKFAMAV